MKAKRIAAFLTALIMLILPVPVTVFADGGTEPSANNNLIWMFAVGALILALIIVFIFQFVYSRKLKRQMERISEQNRMILESRDELEAAREEANTVLEVRTSELRERNEALRKLSNDVIDLLGEVVEGRDGESGTHIQRVKAFTSILAKRVQTELPEYNLTDHTVNLIISASPLHDVGKISIPDAILLKPGRLTPEEFDVMKSHCEKGRDLLEKMRDKWSEEYAEVVSDIAYCHHEKWDGKGYPQGLKGNEIRISAEIVSVADVYDALTTKRVYKDAIPSEEAFNMITGGQCGTYSEQLMEVFASCKEEFAAYAAGGTIAQVEEDIEASVREVSVVNPIQEIMGGSETSKMIIRIVEGIPGGFFMCKADGDNELIYCNKRIYKYYACDTDAEFRMLSHNIVEGLIHPDDWARVKEELNKQIGENEENIWHIEFKMRRNNGTEGWLDGYGHSVHSNVYGDIYYVFVNDISKEYELKQAETAAVMLADEQKRLEHLVKTNIDKTENNGRIFDGVKVLLVDDSDLTREINQEILEDEGAIVTSASSGPEAIEIVKNSSTFDIILMDIVMPDMDGIETTREIRKFDAQTALHTPIVGLTAEGSDAQVREILEAGADDCAGKPLVIPELSKILIACLRQHSTLVKQKLESTIKVANTDSLTGAKNITAYTDKVAELTEKMVADPKLQFAVVMCDIDDLKVENDRFGHDSGDRYIQNCYEIIKQVFASSSIYRIGGDEFVIVLQGHDYANALPLMNSMKKQVDFARKLPDTKSGRASFSAGMAMYDSSQDYSVSDTVKRASDAMYQHKVKEKED